MKYLNSNTVFAYVQCSSCTLVNAIAAFNWYRYDVSVTEKAVGRWTEVVQAGGRTDRKPANPTGTVTKCIHLLLILGHRTPAQIQHIV